MRKLGVVMAWRAVETDLQETIASAQRSATDGDVVFPVEDKTAAGPAQTRHRGIEAAQECDVVAIVDAHMQFDGDVLARMAQHVRDRGGLICAKCYHNPDCSFDSKHPSGAAYYAGADIHYRGRDQNGRQALLWKWSTDKEPGPRACVGGACYVFRREWYMDVGQPLAALPAWGCDEEALSISAWLSGHQPTVFDGRVAHRWRKQPPWAGKKAGGASIKLSRAALIAAVVTEARDRDELMKWQCCEPYTSPEVERWRLALLRQPRRWVDWKWAVPHLGKEGRPPEPEPPVVVAQPQMPPSRGCKHPNAHKRSRYRSGRWLLECPDCGAMRIEGY